MVLSLADLYARIAAAAERGLVTPMGGEGRLDASTGELAGSAHAGRGLFLTTTSSVLLMSFRCGPDRGLALMVAEGNYKDEASMLAAAAATSAFLDELASPILSEVDLGPLLRRSVLEAHERIIELSAEPVTPRRFGTAAGPRSSLRGIGASVVAALSLPHRVWLTSVGECQLWLLRDGAAKRLNRPDTLAYHAGYRDAVRRDPSSAVEGAEHVVTRVLGLTPEAPECDVTRLDLGADDQLVLGNEWLSDHAAALAASARQDSAAALVRQLASSMEAEPGPVPVTVAALTRR